MIVALAGGVGGARLAWGLAQVLDEGRLAIAVNTGDDFEHLGLAISPDLDTVMYTLAGCADRERGWGRADETWRFLEALGALGAPTWFALGDRDLAVHVERTRRLHAGQSLQEVTAHLCQALGVRHPVLPASNEPVRTIVHTGAGELAFQDYFVQQRCAPAVTGFRYDGAEHARPAPALAAALEHSELEAVVLCPSNPYLSIGPILALPSIAAWFARRRVPVVAVSPIIGGAAVKGPAAKIMRELGAPVSVLGVCDYYGALVDGWVIDEADAGHAGALRERGKRVLVTPTLMTTDEDRSALARATVSFARTLYHSAP
jgi:LPPG:FO 2-phospho-L-lactate transferase